MAELIKKAHFKNTAGVIQSAKLHTTLNEVQNQVVPIIVDGIQAYMEFAEVNDPRAISARIKRHNGSVKALLSQAEIPYGLQVFYSSGTFVPPANVRRVRVSMCGGGGGGLMFWGWSQIYYGSNGGDSSFGTYLVAKGGNRGEIDSGKGGGAEITGTIPSVFYSVSGGYGGFRTGKPGVGYGGGGASGTSQAETGGNGGACGGDGTVSGYSGGGGSGQYIINKVITLSDDRAIFVNIGNGGAKGDAGNNSWMGGVGAQGLIFIEWGGSI